MARAKWQCEHCQSYYDSESEAKQCAANGMQAVVDADIRELHGEVVLRLVGVDMAYCTEHQQQDNVAYQKGMAEVFAKVLEERKP